MAVVLVRSEPVAPPKTISTLPRPASPPSSNLEEAFLKIAATARPCSWHAECNKEEFTTHCHGETVLTRRNKSWQSKQRVFRRRKVQRSLSSPCKPGVRCCAELWRGKRLVTRKATSKRRSLELPTPAVRWGTATCHRCPLSANH